MAHDNHAWTRDVTAPIILVGGRVKQKEKKNRISVKGWFQVRFWLLANNFLRRGKIRETTVPCRSSLLLSTAAEGKLLVRVYVVSTLPLCSTIFYHHTPSPLTTPSSFLLPHVASSHSLSLSLSLSFSLSLSLANREIPPRIENAPSTFTN